jgi:hypothetical protein
MAVITIIVISGAIIFDQNCFNNFRYFPNYSGKILILWQHLFVNSCLLSFVVITIIVVSDAVTLDQI